MLIKAWFKNNLQHNRGIKLSKNKGFSITSADRYSLALYELASENNVLSQVEDQSTSILNLISSSKDFSNLIKDPTNNQGDLLKVINGISDNNKFESLLKSFLSFLVTKRRFFYVEQILKSFIEKKISGRVLGPVSAPIFRLKSKFRIRMLIRGSKSLKLQN